MCVKTSERKGEREEEEEEKNLSSYLFISFGILQLSVTGKKRERMFKARM